MRKKYVMASDRSILGEKIAFRGFFLKIPSLMQRVTLSEIDRNDSDFMQNLIVLPL